MSKKVIRTAEGVQVPPRTPEEWRVSELLKQYGCGPISFARFRKRILRPALGF